MLKLALFATVFAIASAFPCDDLTPPGVQFSNGEYDFIYNILSFAIATMGAATTFFFFQFSMVKKQFRTAMIITALVTFIAFYHYFRIFNSFTEAYILMPYGKDLVSSVQCSGIPFNDAYRYVDWLLTVPLLLTELVLVMNLSPEETKDRIIKLGSSAALMIILGYPGEVACTSDCSERLVFWFLAMIPFVYIVYTLFFGLKDAISRQGEAEGLVKTACWVTVLSWCTYPLIYLFPFFGLSGPSSHVAIQVGYSVADIIAKPILGLLVWRIAVIKSNALETANLINH
jgi:bacteriorhodopsin